MSTKNQAYVTPELIVWARVRSGLNHAQVAKSLHVNKEQIIAWEQGDTLPTFSQAIALANALRVPFGYLFLSQPPDVNIPLPDLRTLPNAESREPSVDFLELLYEVLSKQEWYREYALQQGVAELPFVSKFTINNDVADVAADIRSTLLINDDLRKEAGNWENFLAALSTRAEKSGVLVMRSGVVANNTRRSLSVKEFQGFAITDKVAPLVFVNSQDFKTAQIFTLAHELAHIWVGKSGISNADEAKVEVPQHDVEDFCNAVAAETLVPKVEFLGAWEDSRDLLSLARRFRVSSLVILRRAHELNKVTTPEFYVLLKQERRKMTTKSSGGGGDYYRNVPARHSARFIDAVLRDARQGGTVLRDAARLLGMQVPTLIKFMGSSG